MTQPATTEQATAAPTGGDAEIVARPDNWYRGKRIAFAIALIGWGLWSVYDGWVTYPAANEEARKRGALELPHNDASLMLQRAIGVGLPILGAFWITRILRSSRGVYRLRDGLLSIPGHPEMPVEAITQINLERWDRKGIAVLDYNHAGQTGRFTLDDFIYERKPTDEILERIKARIAPEDAGADAAAARDDGTADSHIA